MAVQASAVNTRRLTDDMARAILDTPPVVLDHFYLKDKTTWLEFQRIRWQFSGIETTRHREHSIHGVTNWTCP